MEPAGAVAECRFAETDAGWRNGEEFWDARAALELRDTRTGAAPRQKTTARLAWTRKRLFVRFDCEDAGPWATFTERDAPLYEEEVVEVFLDPFGDLECYFEIEVNPLNTVFDLMARRNRTGWRKALEWRCEDLETAAARTTDGWVAMLSIPFASLTPRAPEAGDTWRGNFFRIDRPKGEPRELSAWSPTGRGTFHVAEKFGVIRFG